LIEHAGKFAAGPYYPHSITPLVAIRERAAHVTHAKGAGILSTRTDGFADAITAARDADVAVCFVGGRSGLLPNCTSGEFRDASDLALPGAQEALIAAVAATGTPTVVVVMSGRVHALTGVVEHAAAILYAWCPGEQGGAAIADVLFGAREPSGRLPITLPRNAGQIPTHHDVRAGGGRSVIFGDYVDGPVAPLYPFGFGLGYTSFAYANLVVEGTRRTDAATAVRIDVTNTGNRRGTDVVQLFARDEVARVARPERQLAGFLRVDCEPGQVRTVRFSVDPTVFAYYDESMRLVVEPGAVRFSVGDQEQVIELAGPERAIAPNDRRPTRASVSG
jgi:beta-glucosidase